MSKRKPTQADVDAAAQRLQDLSLTHRRNAAQRERAARWLGHLTEAQQAEDAAEVEAIEAARAELQRIGEAVQAARAAADA